MVKDRSAEMLIQRAKGPFGGRSLPCSNTFGPTEGAWQRFSSTMDLIAVTFGKWTRAEVIFCLQNKENPLTSEFGFTPLYCPEERKDEIVQILQEQYSKLTFGEMKTGEPYIAVDNAKHILFKDNDGGWHFVMHRD